MKALYQKIKAHYPFRSGTTSYIYPDDVISNAEQLGLVVCTFAETTDSGLNG